MAHHEDRRGEEDTMVPHLCSAEHRRKKEDRWACPVKRGDPIQHIGGGHPRARDVGSKVSCEAHLSDDGLVHEVCNCRPTCIHGFGRGGPGDSRELGTQVWGTEHPAHRSWEELWEQSHPRNVPTAGDR